MEYGLDLQDNPVESTAGITYGGLWRHGFHFKESILSEAPRAVYFQTKCQRKQNGRE
jgi:hypothetical protein